MPSGEKTLIDVAIQIGLHLFNTAVTSQTRCTWIGVDRRRGALSEASLLVLEPLGPTIYGGTAGVSLFLGELYAVTHDVRFRNVALGAIRHALSRAAEVPNEDAFGVYTGRVGIALAAARLGLITSCEDLIEEASQTLRGLPAPDKNASLDVISGLAGAVPALLRLESWLNEPRLRLRASDAAEQLLQIAERKPEGWSWPTRGNRRRARNLTGLSHGAGGFGWALLELYRVVGSEDLLQAAGEAFRYENHWYRRDEDNWPDFRVAADALETASCAVAWCHGAPGIGLTRVRASQIAPADWQEWLVRDVCAAARASSRALERLLHRERADQSPCHGAAGIVDFLLTASNAIGDLAVREGAEEYAVAMGRRFGRSPNSWPCSIERGPQPSLMTGLAGIGYGYLRLAYRDVPSQLLVTGES